MGLPRHRQLPLRRGTTARLHVPEAGLHRQEDRLFWLHSENLDDMVRRPIRAGQLGAKFAVKYPAEKDQSDFSAAITKFQSAGVDTVWFHVAPDLSTKFAAQAKLLGYQPQYVFTLPVGGDIWAAAAGGNLDKGFGLAGFADPQWSGTAKFQEQFHKYYPDEQADEFNLLCYAIGGSSSKGSSTPGPTWAGRLRPGLNIPDIDTGISQPSATRSGAGSGGRTPSSPSGRSTAPRRTRSADSTGSR